MKYETELQLFHEKMRGERKFLKTGKTCEAVRTGKNLLTLVCDKDTDIKLKTRMKKIFIILVALIGFGIYANAQTAQCKITNGNGATFTASVDSYDDAKGERLLLVLIMMLTLVKEL